jgi:hypothetical protein
MTRHPLSIVGAWLVTVSAFVFLLVFVLDLFHEHTNPYFGLVFFLILPMFFVLGLLLIPLGIFFERRRRLRGLEPRQWPRIDLNNPVHRRATVIVAALTFVNVLIVSLAAYRGVEYMETTNFCGQTCHTVMEPEYVAHLDGPHARVACVECHVGSGVSSFVNSKINGLHQVYGVMTGSYERPIPTPVANLRPATETCEHCHSPQNFHGDSIKVVREFANDEKSTESMTKLVMHVGGGPPELAGARGSHWHANPQIEIEFVATDAKREEIPYVRLKDASGTITEFRAPGADETKIAAGARRRMDCVDCHNRPTHAFFPSPERAVDFAISRGAIPTSLPFARKRAVDVLTAKYPDRETANREIARQLQSAYSGSSGGDVDRLVKAVQFLNGRSVFPAMNVSWGTHPSNLGHTDAQGCFRCHDDQHKSADGKVISQECSLCHEVQ